MREDFLYLRIQFDTIFITSFLDNPPASERLDGALEKFIGLQTYDKFVILVNIACGVGGDCGNRLGVNASDTTSVAFFCKSFQTFVPQFHSTG